MIIEHSIPKKQSSPDPNSFAALRKEGIRLIQEMSGDVWTDYNLHDPGVTILEQLCFALTDLIYRSDFSVEDQLTGDDGNIAFEQQALHRPEKIIPCRPWTTADYQQLILDSCPDVDSIWFDASADAALPSACDGLYAATVRLYSRYAADSIGANIKKHFVNARNLCEDIHDSIVVLDNLDCRLIGTVEIDGSREPSDILGQIYYRTVSYIASNIPRPQAQNTGENEQDLISLFTGPRTLHARTRLSDTVHPDNPVLLADLVGMLQDIQGVVRVRNLTLRVMHPDGTKDYRESVSRRHGNAALWLRIPRPDKATEGEIGALRLLKHGRPISTPVDDTWHKFYQLITADKSARMKEVDIATFYASPTGVKRNFRDYFSMQNHFPDNYGINASGVPASAPPEVRARARQLKAYLLLFEQVMANHLANVDGIRDLFSMAGRAGTTYKYQVLNDTTITKAQLYREDPPGQFLQRAIEQFDDPAERKSRQFDYMLAVFGESFSQKSLRHFNKYSARDPHEEIANNKAALLQNIVEVTRDRVAGHDYFSLDSVGGFARRVSLLLGFHRHGASLTAALQAAGIDPASLMTGSSSDENGGAETGIDSGHRVPTMRLDSDPDAAPWRDAQKILRAGKHTRSLLAEGTRLENYRLAPMPGTDRVTLRLGSTAGGQWHSLATTTDQGRGARAANALHQCLIDLCEGLQVVEHVLLRPAGAEHEHAGQQPCWGGLQPWEEFYPLRFSVFFPDWTPRCSDSQFRSLVEETVRINSPAHVYGQCLWLGFRQLLEFETLFGRWATIRQQPDADPAQLDDCAVKLIDFMLSLQPVGHD